MYTCTFCVAQGGDPTLLTFTSDTDWLNHLICAEHGAYQRARGAKKTFAHWDAKRTLVVSNIFGLKSKDLINFFATFGDLQNFYYIAKVDGNAHYCKALMVDEKSAKVIHKQGQHQLGGVTFATRLQNQEAVKPKPATATSPASSSKSASICSSASSVTTTTLNGERYDKFMRLVGKTDEGGYTPGVGNRCRICETVTGEGTEQWIQHLVSVEHQNVHRQNQHLRKILWDLDKTAMVSQIKGMQSVHVLRYVVACGGFVIDFSYLALKDGGTDACYALFASKDGAEKLLKSSSSQIHVVGPERKKVRISPIKEDQKVKWRRWRNNIVNKLDLGEHLMHCDDVSEDEDGVGKVVIEESGTTTDGQKVVVKVEDKPSDDSAVVVVEDCSYVEVEDLTNKRKSIESITNATVNQFTGLKGLPIEKQLEKFQSDIGWSERYLLSAVKFVDQTVGILNLKQKKIPFGDLTTGLGLKTLPTIQLLVDVQEILESKPDSAKSVISAIIKKCSQALEKIDKHKIATPILKIWTTESELCFTSLIEDQATCLKLRFSNSLPLHECRLFKFFCDFDARIRPIGVILSCWASSNNFLQYAKQDYPNQLIILMIIFFLQNKKILPTVHKLQEAYSELESPKIINGNNVSFCSDLAKAKKLHPNPLESILEDSRIRAMSIIGLIKDWYQFFANVDLKENAICSRFGYLVPKKDFQPDSVGNLPGDLCRVYRFGMSKGDRSQTNDSVNTKKFLCSQTSLCIQNPFDLSINSSRGVTPHEVVRFQNGCKEASAGLSNLLVCDQPDLTEFLVKTTPVLENNLESVNKKAKMTEDNPIDAIPTIVQKSDSVISTTSRPSVQNSTKVIANASSVATASAPSSSAETKTRPAAADFFENLNSPCEHSESGDHDEDEDNGEDEDESINNESAIGDATSKDCTITLNISLFQYFERVCSGTQEMKYRKLQLLILQHILEFNQKFWTNCLGLVFLPKVGQKFWAEDFSKVLTEGKIKTDQKIIQKVNAISEIEEDINLSFRVKSDGKILHKLFLEEETKSLRPKDWAGGKSLTELSLQLYEEVPESRLQEIKSSSYTDYISETEIAFDCQLIGAVYKRISNSTPIAFLTMNTADGSFGAVDTNNARIDVIKGLYRKLCMSYITKMVKRWLYESKDFDHTKALNFVKNRNQKWNKKGKKKKKNELKRLVKNEERINPNKIHVHNPGLKLSKPGGHTDQRPNTLPQFTSNVVLRPTAPLMSVGGGNVHRPQYNNNWQQPCDVGRRRGDQQQGYRYQPMQIQPNPQQQYYGTLPNATQSERVLRNPDPQGLRTFYPSHQQPSQPHTQHLLPNPQGPTTTINPNQIYDIVGRLDNAQKPFQDILQKQTLAAHGSFNNNSPLPLFRNSQYSQPLLATPNSQYSNNNYHYQPTHQSKAQQHITPEYQHNSQKFNPSHSQLYHYEQQESFEPRQNQIPPLIPNPPRIKQDNDLRSNQFPNPIYGHKQSSNNLNPSSRFFNTNSSNQAQGTRGSESREQFPLKPDPQPLFETSFSRPERPSGHQQIYSVNVQRQLSQPKLKSLFDCTPEQNGMETSASSRPTRYFNNNDSNKPSPTFSDFLLRNPAYTPARPQNQERYDSGSSSRPSQPMRRGFITGGYLSTEKVESDDDDIEIIYDLDPKGNSSPPPPPLKNFKVGAPFPVPNKPTMGRGRPISPSLLSSDYSSDRRYMRQYGPSSSPNRVRAESLAEDLFVTPENFQGFGMNPSGGDSSQFHSRRRF